MAHAPRPLSAPRNRQAALLALLASAILSFVDNFVQVIAQDGGLWQFQMTRTLFALPLLGLGAAFFRMRLRPHDLRAVVLRSVSVAVALLIYFATLGILPVAQAGAGLFSAPIWVVALSALLFATRISVFHLAAMISGFLGVLMLLQPDLGSLSGLSIMPLFAGAFYAAAMLLTRHRCGAESPLTLALGMFLAMGLSSAVILACLTLWPVADPGFITQGWTAPSARFLGVTLFHAVGAVIAVSCLAQAYRIGAPHFIAVFEYSFLIFASLWAFLLWGDETNTIALVGVGVILTSGGALSWLQHRRD